MKEIRQPSLPVLFLEKGGHSANRELNLQASRLAKKFAIWLHMTQHGVSMMPEADYWKLQTNGEMEEEKKLEYGSGKRKWMTEYEYEKQLKKNGEYAHCLEKYISELPTNQTQPKEFVGEYDLPVLIPSGIPLETALSRNEVDYVKDPRLKNVGDEKSPNSYVIWVNTDTFIEKFKVERPSENNAGEPYVDGIDKIVENLGPSRRCISPLEVPFVCSSYPEIVRDCSAYVADSAGNIFSLNQSSFNGVVGKPSLMLVRDAIDRSRFLPNRKILLAGVAKIKA
jgi:hypothetical protein